MTHGLHPGKLRTFAGGLVVLLAGAASLHGELVESKPHQLRIESGFSIQQVSGPELANDIWSMTLDWQGRPVVSGPGYVRRLMDQNGDGAADGTEEAARTTSGATGLCYDGSNLLLVADGGLWLQRDVDGDGRTDGVPEKILSLGMGEHGAHAIKKGPDGGWYLLGGNDSGFTNQTSFHSHSLVRNPVAGALIRLDPTFKNPLVIAHGFRNPYDFDFTANGGMVTWDSDCERDYPLPWYVPTRVFEIQPAAHHGWQLKGYTRSWARPSREEDSVEPLAWLGRASPTGVVHYQHMLFPPSFRGGTFLLDWTFGRIWFLPASGSAPRPFLEPAGPEGFAPTDAVIEPDGSLLVSIGGRRTRGAVYRIRPEGTKPTIPGPVKTVQEVLDHPQPWEAWARSRWEPVAKQLGRQAFESALGDKSFSESRQLRSVEILSGLFGGMDEAGCLAAIGKAGLPDMVQARMIATLNPVTIRPEGRLLSQAFSHRSPQVRAGAWLLLAKHNRSTDRQIEGDWMSRLDAALADEDVSVRRASRLAAATLGERLWQAYWNKPTPGDAKQACGRAWAAVERGNVPAEAILKLLLPALESRQSTELKLRAMRAIVRALGDWNLEKPTREVFTAYELRDTGLAEIPFRTNLIAAAQGLLKSSPPETPAALESSRLLAMLKDDSAQAVQLVLEKISPTSKAQQDFHYLAVLAKLEGNWATNDPVRVVDGLLGMERKLAGLQLRPKQVWTERLQEISAALAGAHYAVIPAMLAHPAFPTAAHVGIIRGTFQLADDARAAARLYLDVVKRDTDFPWTSPLLDLLSLLRPQETYPELRKKWNDPVVKEDVLAVIAMRPQEADRPKMIEHLESSQPQSVKACVLAITRLQPDNKPGTLAPLLRLLRKSYTDPSLKPIRQLIVGAFQRQAGQKFGLSETSMGDTDPAVYYRPLFDWFAVHHPESVKDLEPAPEPRRSNWKSMLPEISSSQGDASRGKKWFQERACATCHDIAGSLGPSLRGVTKRMSNEAILESIFDPSRNVAPAYALKKYNLRDGRSVEGQEVFLSADGVMVLTAPGTTVRIPQSDIRSHDRSERSMMPENLLEGMKAQDVADLLEYLRSQDSTNTPKP